MMKNLILSLLFFFGPALLMFLGRYFSILLRLWFLARRMRNRAEPEVIDITPKSPHPPSVPFIVLSLMVSLAITIFAWQQLGEEADVGKHYVPAHIGTEGEVVPGRSD